jgi:hypothetical protein
VNLLDRLAADAKSPDLLRGVVATVTAVGSGTVTVSVQGGTVAGVPKARSYTSPAVNDVVLVVKVGSAWLALTALG